MNALVTATLVLITAFGAVQSSDHQDSQIDETHQTEIQAEAIWDTTDEN